MSGTLFVATCALSVACVSLGWQIVAYLLNGSRLVVRLYLGLAGDERPKPGVITAPAHLWDPNKIPKTFVSEQPIIHEVVVVRVHNRGRTAVTCSQPSLDFGHERVIRPSMDTTLDSPSDERRIEPGDFREWVMQPWPAVHMIRKERPGAKLRVRARIEEGTGRLRYSSWWLGWIVPPEMSTFAPQNVQED